MQDSRLQQSQGSPNSPNVHRTQHETSFKVDAEERTDLYNIVRDMREVEYGETKVSRVFYAAQLLETEKARFDLENAMNNFTANYETETGEPPYITGFLLARGAFVFHFLEAESKVLNDYLRQVYSDYKQKNTVYSGIYILAFNEENPERFYDEWGAYNALSSGVTINKPEKSDAEQQDRIHAIYNMFGSAGAKLREKERTQKKKSENKWKEASDEIAISNEDFSIMINPRFMSIDEYYEMYLEDLEIELDNELQYPQHPTLLDTLEYRDNLE